MKICLFRAFPDPYRKSMQIYADQLIQRMDPLLHNGDQIVECLPANVRLRPRWKRYLDQYLRYQRYAGYHCGDVNHVIDHGYGHLVRSLPPHSSVVTFHDSTVTKVNGVSLTTRLSLRYSLGAIRHAARIVTDSHQSRCDLLQLIDYPEDRIRVVYPGIDPAFRVMPDRESIRSALRLPRRYVLHVGNALPYMNIEGVLRTFHRLVEAGSDLWLVKVGEAFSSAQSELIDRLGLFERIRHLGRISFTDLPGVYNCAEVLLYPVLYAGFGLPPLEAMACGVPVVCSERGALPEVLGDAAVYADAENPDELAARVSLLLSDRTAWEMYRARGLNRSARYSWNSTAREMLAVYRELAR